MKGSNFQVNVADFPDFINYAYPHNNNPHLQQSRN